MSSIPRCEAASISTTSSEVPVGDRRRRRCTCCRASGSAPARSSAPSRGSAPSTSCRCRAGRRRGRPGAPARRRSRSSASGRPPPARPPRRSPAAGTSGTARSPSSIQAESTGRGRCGFARPAGSSTPNPSSRRRAARSARTSAQYVGRDGPALDDARGAARRAPRRRPRRRHGLARDRLRAVVRDRPARARRRCACSGTACRLLDGMARRSCRAHGLRAIAISHPHYYTTIVDWSRAFGGVPVYVHADDREWVHAARPVRRVLGGRGARPRARADAAAARRPLRRRPGAALGRVGTARSSRATSSRSSPTAAGSASCTATRT